MRKRAQMGDIKLMVTELYQNISNFCDDKNFLRNEKRINLENFEQ